MSMSDTAANADKITVKNTALFPFYSSSPSFNRSQYLT